MGSNVERLLEELKIEARDQPGNVGRAFLAAAEELEAAIEADREEGIEVEGYEGPVLAVEHKESGKIITHKWTGERLVRIQSESAARRYVMGNEDVFRVVQLLIKREAGDSEEEA